VIGAQIDIGPNLVDLGKFAVPVIVAAIGAHQARKGKKAAESAAHELQPNSGSSAIDRLEAGQRQMLDELHDLRAVVETHTEQLARIGTPDSGHP
jgi:hypothetical protein